MATVGVIGLIDTSQWSGTVHTVSGREADFSRAILDLYCH